MTGFIGVVDTAVGYAGGNFSAPTYEDVCYKDTGHAEVVLVEYDASKVSYADLLEVFWRTHDPTQIDRQGADVGSQYRSVIFYANDEQKRIAESYIAQLNEAKVFESKIATQVVPLKAFYEAESYHQDYLVNHPNEPYIVYNDMPKLKNLRAQLPELCKK